MTVKEHLFELNGFMYKCDIVVTVDGCEIEDLVECNEDETETPVTDEETKILIQFHLNHEFEDEIDRLLLDEAFDNACEKADMY